MRGVVAAMPRTLAASQHVCVKGVQVRSGQCQRVLVEEVDRPGARRDPRLPSDMASRAGASEPSETIARSAPGTCRPGLMVSVLARLRVVLGRLQASSNLCTRVPVPQTKRLAK
ncbi:hypothetical protein CGLO_10607 [Colletotrichum gloeosporioides Cg-14]|uniref:Uncharacterized protein n=1 Tax=Colletotrichum gloeosporioides (strain Cg-14) TaxID=1237896 RepID=T0LP91_COLGC|nr:hypothetical protein CGLO_10607 [Colletotrichum gloeosporioides Cg-14]